MFHSSKRPKGPAVSCKSGPAQDKENLAEVSSIQGNDIEFLPTLWMGFAVAVTEARLDESFSFNDKV